MPRKTGQAWEPSIPLRVAEIYLLGVERLLSVLPAGDQPRAEYQIAESRTRFLRELLEDIRKQAALDALIAAQRDGKENDNENL